MKLENQLTSIEPSIKLRELGVVQKSLFIYVKSEAHGIKPYYIETEFDLSEHIQIERVCSAYTVAELGLTLPNILEFDDGSIYEKVFILGQHKRPGNSFSISYYNIFDQKYLIIEASKSKIYGLTAYIIGHTEADARANMLIYLLENKLIDVAEVNKALEG